ncbi:MAG: J domain-containing protein [Actinomycetes bacterium]
MSDPGQRTHYQVLGISESASADEVRRAHRQLAQVLHPDRQAGASPAEQTLAERRMREVNAAWTALSDPTRRAAYDRSLRAARTGPAADSVRHAAPACGPMASRFVEEDVVEDRFSEVDPDEPELSPAHFWLLRRGPLVAALLVGFLVFVVTAYAGGDQQPARPAATAQCVREVSSRQFIRINCLEQNDGTVVGRAAEVLACPSGQRGVLVVGEEDQGAVCIRTDVPREGLQISPSTSAPRSDDTAQEGP